jgi:hypothetical protein
MQFLSRTQIIFAIGAVVLVLFVLDLVRRRKLSEEYALLWVLSSIGMASLGLITPLLETLTRALGMRYESSTAFAFGVTFGIVMLLYMSIQLSKLSRAHQSLTREMALLAHEIERLRGKTGASE